MSSITAKNADVAEGPLKSMRTRGGQWACYENSAMDSASFGERLYLQYGKDCTHETPPVHGPDGEHGLGWKYRFAGLVDLETGTVTK